MITVSQSDWRVGEICTGWIIAFVAFTPSSVDRIQWHLQLLCWPTEAIHVLASCDTRTDCLVRWQTVQRSVLLLFLASGVDPESLYSLHRQALETRVKFLIFRSVFLFNSLQVQNFQLICHNGLHTTCTTALDLRSLGSINLLVAPSQTEP